MAIKIIVDTHIFLWMNQAPEKLSTQSIALFESPEYEIYLSAASAFEISIKYYQKKLMLPNIPEKYVPMRILSNSLLELPISARHTLIAGAFLSAHRDPFDRLIAAQSQCENMKILTVDKKFSEFPCQIIWAD